MIQKLVFGCVSLAANFRSSLAPCYSAMVARSRRENWRRFLAKNQLLNHFVYSNLFMLWVFFVSVFVAAVYGQPSSIFIFGDSHCLAFEKIAGCQPIHIGSITMHRIGRDGLSILDIRKSKVKEEDVVIFCFGEIDVRCHINKQCEINHRPLEEVIETLTHAYLETILHNRSFYKEIVCIIYSVPPPTDAHFSESYPFYGDLKERIHISKMLNAKLEALCAEHQLLFLDVYDQYADSQGALNPVFSDGTVHISSDHHQWIDEKLFLLLREKIIGKIKHF